MKFQIGRVGYSFRSFAWVLILKDEINRAVFKKITWVVKKLQYSTGVLCSCVPQMEHIKKKIEVNSINYNVITLETYLEIEEGIVFFFNCTRSWCISIVFSAGFELLWILKSESLYQILQMYP